MDASPLTHQWEQHRRRIAWERGRERRWERRSLPEHLQAKPVIISAYQDELRRISKLIYRKPSKVIEFQHEH